MDAGDQHGGVYLSQASSVDMLLNKFHLTDAKGVITPVQKGEAISARGSPKTEEERTRWKELPYREWLDLYCTSLVRGPTSHLWWESCADS